ncbi:transcription factor bHLH18-like [Senna tora]|uniref:Transcription factor bHLH18-like n=1 Tax=Senna tora TaxID=362788 RepID=A0A834TRL1_9FABA|nr:transcription factor bHLH18-like [Senna tora]
MEKAIKELKKQNNKAVMMEMNEHESQPDTTSSCGSNIDGSNESLPVPEPELHNLQVSLLSTTVLPFGNFTLDITIIAQTKRTEWQIRIDTYNLLYSDKILLGSPGTTISGGETTLSDEAPAFTVLKF